MKVVSHSSLSRRINWLSITEKKAQVWKQVYMIVLGHGTCISQLAIALTMPEKATL
jgi:hypothetical protein